MELKLRNMAWLRELAVKKKASQLRAESGYGAHKLLRPESSLPLLLVFTWLGYEDGRGAAVIRCASGARGIKRNRPEKGSGCPKIWS